MRLERILPFARNLLSTFVEESGIAIDATCGNGHDTLFLAKIVGPTGKVFGFDVQEQAISSTRNRLIENGGFPQVTLIHDSHALVKNYIPEEFHGQIQASIFNLGYLPGSDKSVVTTAPSTVQAIESCLEITRSGGLVLLVVYPGHEEGQLESEIVKKYATSLSQEHYHVLNYGFINQKNNPPYILAIEKR